MKHPSLLFLSLPIGLGILLTPTFALAQVANGSFESNNTNGWTVGGSGRAQVLQNTNIRVGTAAAPMPAVPDGTYFLGLSTGPGNRGGSAQQIDENNINDFDISTLSTSLSVTGPAFLSFYWAFPSTEPDANPPYDDIFDVTINGMRLFGGSVNAVSNNVSNFPDAPDTGFGTVNWTINSGNLNGVRLSRGVGAWNYACIPLPRQGTYTANVMFRVADQADGNEDSTLLLDDVRIDSQCPPRAGVTIEARTTTIGSNISLKNQGLVFEQAQQSVVTSSSNGSVLAVFSSANLTGNNSNLIRQPLVLRNGTWGRVEGFSPTRETEYRGLSLSANGIWLTFLSQEEGVWSLWRYQPQAGAGSLVKIAESSLGCDIQNPAINDAGNIVSFDSNCNALTGQGNTRKAVYLRLNTNGTTASRFAFPAGNCVSREPRMSNTGRWLGLFSNCNPPGRSNGDGNEEIFVFDTTSNQITTSSRWRQLTNTTGDVFHADLSLADAGSSFSNQRAIYISSQNTGSNADGSFEVFSWVGNNTTSNNGVSTQITANTATADYYTQVRLVGTSGYFAWERIDFFAGITEVGVGRAYGGTVNITPVSSVFYSDGLAVSETTTETAVHFIAADPIIDNSDMNQELWTGRVNK